VAYSGRKHPLEVGQGLSESKFLALEKSGHLPFVEEQKHFVEWRRSVFASGINVMNTP
jgi:hypothetical protein